MFAADLHTHSRFARACSPQLNFPNLSAWGELKGIDLIGTGDALHPQWQKEIESELKETAPGVYSLKDGSTKFLLTTELACVYTEAGRGRRVPLLIYFPSLQTFQKITTHFS